MIRARLLERTEWEARLRALGAERLENVVSMHATEVWIRRGSDPFTVPADKQGRCDYWAFRKIYVEQGGRPLHEDGEF
jgi:hypothetical protein